MSTGNLIFNNYYINKIKIDSVFHFEQISVIETQTIINNLKCKISTGTDNVSQLLLKTLSHTSSLSKGIFPNKLKIAKIIPIFKNGDEYDINNYRLISLLPSISKVFENIVYNQIFQYFTINKLFKTNQYGFRAEHSTELALSDLIDRILLYLYQKKISITIFIDLSKAFDTIDHSILISKMKYFGINNTELDWIKCYLLNRQQYVEFDDFQSNTGTITTGVPQGSVPGPLICIIYINDLTTFSTKITPIMYPDDTTLLSTLDNFTSNNERNASNKINAE